MALYQNLSGDGLNSKNCKLYICNKFNCEVDMDDPECFLSLLKGNVLKWTGRTHQSNDFCSRRLDWLVSWKPFLNSFADGHFDKFLSHQIIYGCLKIPIQFIVSSLYAGGSLIWLGQSLIFQSWTTSSRWSTCMFIASNSIYLFILCQDP